MEAVAYRDVEPGEELSISCKLSSKQLTTDHPTMP